MQVILSSVLSLDVGAKRIGVAVASLSTRLPRPLTTIEHGDTVFDTLRHIIKDEGAQALVVGFPRGLQGQHTAQTNAIKAFVTKLREHISLPIHLQDEAMTSKYAEEELKKRGKPYARGDIDALAATYILEDFLSEHQNVAEL